MISYSLAAQPSVRKRSYLKTFTVFPNLPVEMRLKIWRSAAFIPRVVPVAVKDIGTMPIIGDRAYKYVSPINPPVLLQISQEARSEGLKHYKLDFAVQISGQGVNLFTEARVYINFVSDTIWPLGPYTLSSFEDFCKRDIEHVAITISPFEDPADLPSCMIQEEAFDFLRVKTVTICHPSCFDPRVPIDFEAPAVKCPSDRSLLSPEDSHYGLVWALDEIVKAFNDREKDCLERAKRNKKSVEMGLPGSEATADETSKGPWERPEVRIMNLVQQRPAGWPVHGWFIDGVDRFQPED